MDTSIPYYEDTSRISNSNLGQFIKYGPAYLRRMLDGKEEGLKGSCLDTGTMIHMYLLQPEEFLDKYTLTEHETPSSAQQKAFAEALANSVEIEPDKAVISAYKSAYSTTGQSDDKILAKGLEMALKLKSYIDYIKDPDKKIAISGYQLNMLKTIKQNIEEHKLASSLMCKQTDCEEHNEFQINWEFPKAYNGIKLPCKSLLDRLILNVEKKQIILIDLKTSSHLSEFKKSMQDFDYLRQLSYYWFAIMWYLKNERNVDIQQIDDTWDLRVYIIGIDVNTYQVRVFRFSDLQLQSRVDTITSTIERICWHIDTNLWDQNKEYYEGNGEETLLV